MFFPVFITIKTFERTSVLGNTHRIHPALSPHSHTHTNCSSTAMCASLCFAFSLCYVSMLPNLILLPLPPPPVIPSMWHVYTIQHEHIITHRPAESAREPPILPQLFNYYQYVNSASSSNTLPATCFFLGPPMSRES